MDNRPKTIICDIDGVLFKHMGDITQQHLITPELLPGTKERLKQWDMQGCDIILITGRRESTRKYTEKQLSEAGIFYDHLIMGASGGIRVLINDSKPGNNEPTAIAVTLERNKGMGHQDIAGESI